MDKEQIVKLLKEGRCFGYSSPYSSDIFEPLAVTDTEVDVYYTICGVTTYKILQLSEVLRMFNEGKIEFMGCDFLTGAKDKLH